jgi:hypothetical protein
MEIEGLIMISLEPTTSLCLEPDESNPHPHYPDHSVRYSIPRGGWEFFSLPQRPDRLWGPLTSYPMCARGSFPGVKATGEWSSTSIPQYIFMVWCSVKHRGNFTFTFHSVRYSFWNMVWKKLYVLFYKQI